MKTKVILGQISELLTVIGSLFFAYLPAGSWGSISGAIVAAAAVVFAIIRHDGIESLFTLVRKFLSTIPAIGVHFGWIDAEVGTKIIAGLGPVSALVWSYLTNSGKVSGPVPPGAIKVLILFFCLTFFLSSCGVVSSYQVDGSDRDWVNEPVQILPASAVTPLVDVPLPPVLGGGQVSVPINVAK